MLLYRYLNQQYALEALQSKQLKVGRLSELNDPADCRPRLINNPDPNDPDFEERYFSEIGKEIGVLCFSATTEDPVIWSHYADAHRGIALGYEFQQENFAPRLHKILYEKRRPTIDYKEAERIRADDPTNLSFINLVVSQGFKTKARTWKYEREFRIFTSLGPVQCEMRGQHYFFRHLGLQPEQVIIGARCPLTARDIARAISSAGGIPAGTEIKKAKLHSEFHKIVTD